MKFFKRFVIGDPLWKACNKHNLDIVFNILENIQGIGCTINKDPTGVGWSIAVDGNTDIPLPPNANPFQVPFDADYVGGIFSSMQRTKYKGQLYHFDSATDESLDDKGKVYLVLREKTSYGAQIIYSDITRYIIVPDGKSLSYVGDSNVGNLPEDGAHTIEISGWSEKADLASKPENGALVMRSQQGGDVEYLPISLIEETQLDDKSLAYTTDAEENKKAEIKGFSTESSSTNLDLGGDIPMRKEDKSGIHFINHTAFAPRADGISLTTSGSGDEYTTQISGFDMGAEQATTPHRDGAKFLLRVPSGDSANVDYCPMEKYAVGADGKSLQMDSTDVADANGTTPPTGQTCHELAINGWNDRDSLTEKPLSASVVIRPNFGGQVQYLPLALIGGGISIPDGTYNFVTDVTWTGTSLVKTTDTWVVSNGVVTITHGTSTTLFTATTEMA